MLYCRCVVVLEMVGVAVARGYVNVASSVVCVLSLFYLRAFEMIPVCVWLHLMEVCFLLIVL